MKFIIEEQLANNILAYLAKQPLAETIDLFLELKKITPLDETPPPPPVPPVAPVPVAPPVESKKQKN